MVDWGKANQGIRTIVCLLYLTIHSRLLLLGPRDLDDDFKITAV